MALKTFNPTTPSRRELVLVDRTALWKGKPLKELTEGLSKKGGRNNVGTNGAIALSTLSAGSMTFLPPLNGLNMILIVQRS